MMKARVKKENIMPQEKPEAAVNPIPIPTPVPLPPIPIPIPPVTTPIELTPTSPSTTTTAPTSGVAVTVPNQSGTVTFSLVVTDNLGEASQPATVNVSIQGPPIAVLTATPTTIATGGTIELSGSGSTTSGSIASYKFSLVPPPA
jgi:hypothetical protein